MKKFIIFLVLLLAVGFLLSQPQQVFAGSCGSTCTGTCVSCNYCYWSLSSSAPRGTQCPGSPYCAWVCTPDYCCQYITPIGNCTVCDSTGTCYYGGCPLPTSPPGGGGGATNTPTPTNTTPATLTAVAVKVSTSDTSCAAIASQVTAGDTSLSGTVFGFTVNPPAPKTQSGATPVSWSVSPGIYTLTALPPSANYVLQNACEYKNGTLVGLGWGAYAAGGDNVSWQIGYTYGTAWAQTQGGDAYASGIMRSYIPLVTPRVFNLNGSGGYPGAVIYGTDYDFDPASSSKGPTLVSSTNWLVNASRTTTDYYQVFYNRFGAPTTATTAAPFNNLAGVTQPASNCSSTSCTPYYVVGDMTTSGTWSVGATDNIVILVNGNLTIGGPITVTPGGFIAFIVHGNITVANTVGTAYNSTADQVDGVYIATTATQTGTFDTGYSTAAGSARFVGKGMFVADNFALHRDLDAYGGNVNDSAELFTYDPELLFTMPQVRFSKGVPYGDFA